ncbi:MAG: Flp pilus assembly protein CpaB [Sphingomicrobium sp.]
MRRQTLIALGAAIFLGLIAVLLANSFLLKTEAKNDARATVKVAVAAVPLDYGADLTPENVRFVDYPSGSVPPGAFTNAAQLLPAGKRRVALMRMAVNEPILSSKVTGEGQNASIAALLPDGMRAASVRINDVSGVAGFIQPNDSVDVLITRTIPGAGSQVTDVLLQNTRVIAMGQDSERADGKPVVAATATLEVDPIAAQKLALAQESGSLSLVLRKPGTEQDNPYVQTVSIDDLRYGRMGVSYPRGGPPRNAAPAAPRPVARPRPVAQKAPTKIVPAPRAGSNVEVIRGTAATNYEVGRYGA